MEKQYSQTGKPLQNPLTMLRKYCVGLGKRGFEFVKYCIFYFWSKIFFFSHLVLTKILKLQYCKTKDITSINKTFHISTKTKISNFYRSTCKSNFFNFDSNFVQGWILWLVFKILVRTLCLFHPTLPTHQNAPYPNNFIAIFNWHIYAPKGTLGGI